MNSAPAVTSRQVAIIDRKGQARLEERASQEISLPGLRIQVLSNEHILLLQGETIEAATQATTRRQLINRFFSIPSLKSLRLNRRKGNGRLQYPSPFPSTATLLPPLAWAMGERPPAALPLLHQEVILR